MVDVLEHERSRLIDRSCARAGGRVGLRAGVNRKRGKAWGAVGHGESSMLAAQWDLVAKS